MIAQEWGVKEDSAEETGFGEKGGRWWAMVWGQGCLSHCGIQGCLPDGLEAPG